MVEFPVVQIHNNYNNSKKTVRYVKYSIPKFTQTYIKPKK